MKTGSQQLDSIIQYDSKITMIYGQAATGKTTMAKLAAMQAAKEGKKVIFIDSENGFSIDRFRQLAGPDYIKYFDNLIFFKPGNMQEQRKTIKSLIPIIEAGKIGLVIIDTIGIHYRIERSKDEKYANKSMDEAIRIFRWIVSKNIPVIMTNQVYSDLNNNVKNVGGNILFNACNLVIHLEKEPRILVLKKPTGKEAKFEIIETGLRLLE